MKTPFTLGPWHIESGNHNRHICHESGATVAIVDEMYLQRISDRARGEAQANANLIAAAPELLAALEAALSKGGDFVGWEKKARAAISKAKGLQPHE